MKREYPFGAEVFEDGVHFRVWAPEKKNVELLFKEKRYPLEQEKDGWFSLFLKEAKAGDLYWYSLDGGAPIADPASYSQPQGITGPSCVFDPNAFVWKDKDWEGAASLKGQVLYEMHIGTFTAEGTWKSAIEKLKFLAEVGITLIEMMPIGEFAGKFGWGYDGIFLFAPYSQYGKPEDLMAFVEAAHQVGIGVVLDVVYNHFGPGLDLHRQFAPHFFNKELQTDWGEAIDFDGPHSKSVRSFFISNALYFLEKFHFDGLRLDATQNIYDRSKKHILLEINEKIEDRFPNKKILLIAENESQRSELLQDYKFDAVWNDDFHHAARVALCGRQEAYFTDYSGEPQEILSAIKYGYLYQGQYYAWQEQLRGTPALDISPEHFIHFLENHDQLANVQVGQRIKTLSNPALYRSFTALMILSPNVPLLFQGQEIGSTTPFNFFADLPEGFRSIVWSGRKEFLSQFPSFMSLNALVDYPDPSNPDVFMGSKLNWDKIDDRALNFHKTLIDLRKKDPVFCHPKKIDGAIIRSQVLLLRFFGETSDRLVLCNFGSDFIMQSIAEPLFAPPLEQYWALLLSTEEGRFGGSGSPKIIDEIPEWILSGYTTYVLGSVYDTHHL